MSLNSTPRSERLHLGIFGRRNAGKSSLINAITGQDMAIVSDIKGTTTDPVYKSMELLPLGPVVVIDTPGLDDTGLLGEQRVKKARQVLNKTDIAILVVDATTGLTAEDNELLMLIKDKGIPCIKVYNKSDLTEKPSAIPADSIWVSSLTGDNITELKELLGVKIPNDNSKMKLVADLLSPNDFVVLVVPIDSAAPKGRLILPQQQTIRDTLEAGATAIVVREHELIDTLRTIGKKPRMVITDSQAFAKVSAETPEDIPLTSFSILFARYKGNLEQAVKGAGVLNSIQDSDKILISEGCTHHRQCDDIGTIKLPQWIRQYTGANPEFHFTSGTEFPEKLGKFKLIIHCGGCMISEREMKYRLATASDQDIPMTNYGTAIAHIHGILKRSVEIFPHIAQQL